MTSWRSSRPDSLRLLLLGQQQVHATAQGIRMLRPEDPFPLGR